MTSGDVGLVPIFAWPLSAFFDWRTRAVRAVFIEEIGKHKSAAYVDLFREAADEPFNTDVPRYYAADRFHPSGQGYALWFAQLQKVL